jgi:hypothetical protein
MDIQHAVKQLQSVTGLIGIIGGLLAAIAAFNKQLREALDVLAQIGAVGLATAAAVLLLVGTAMFAAGRRKSSRLIDPDALRLDPRNPAHLIGRSEDVRLLREKCEIGPLVFLVGDSGSGKSALVQAGLVPTAAVGPLLPVYIDMANLDWEAGPLAALADRFWRCLDPEDRATLGAQRPPAPGNLPALLAAAYPILGRTPLLIFDQVDDYQLRHRHRLLPEATRTWLPAAELVAANAFWATLAKMVTARHVHLLLVIRSDNADGLESLRIYSDPLVVRLEPLSPGFVLRALDQLTTRAADAPPVVERPEKAWTRLRVRLADDLERGGAVLPQQLKVALLGLARLKPLSVLAYDRAGGIEGLEALYIETAVSRAASRAGVSPGVVRSILLRLVERDGIRRGAPLTIGQLAEGIADCDNVRLAAALEALEEADVLRRRGADLLTAFQLDHDYLARGILRAEVNADRWKARLALRAGEFADARGSLRSRWRTMLGLREQVMFVFARLLGRFRYGEHRGFALISAVPYAIIASFIWLFAMAGGAFMDVGRAGQALRSIAPAESSGPHEYRALAEMATLGLPGRAVSALWLLAKPEYSMAATTKPEPIVRAVVGLDEDRAVLLVERLFAPQIRDRHIASVDVMAAVLPLLPAGAVARLPPPLPEELARAQAEGRAIDMDFFVQKLRSLQAEAAELEDAPTLRVSAAREAVYERAEYEHGYAAGMLFKAREDLKANRHQGLAVQSFARVAARVARRLPTEGRGEVVRALLGEIRARRGDLRALRALAFALQVVAPALSEQTRHMAAGQLLGEIRLAAGSPEAVVPLAMGYAAVAPVTGGERSAAASVVLAELRRSKGLGAIVNSLAEAYAILTLPWVADADLRPNALEIALEATTGRRSRDDGPPWADDRSPWAKEFQAEQGLEDVRRLLERCGLDQCFALFASSILNRVSARPFSERAALVLELLKVPASTRSGLTGALLARIHAEAAIAKTDLPEGGLWEFVAWSDENGLEPGRPLDPSRLFKALPL